TAATSIVHNNVLEGLVKVDRNGNLVPGLGESWTVSPDATEYVFRLRRGVRFHHGQPFTSADVKAKFEVARDPNSGHTNRLYYSNIASIETPDDYTVVFRMSAPDAEFLYNLARPDSVIPPAGYGEAQRTPPIVTAPARPAVPGQRDVPLHLRPQRPGRGAARRRHRRDRRRRHGGAGVPGAAGARFQGDRRSLDQHRGAGHEQLPAPAERRAGAAGHQPRDQQGRSDGRGRVRFRPGDRLAHDPGGAVLRGHDGDVSVRPGQGAAALGGGGLSQRVPPDLEPAQRLHVRGARGRDHGRAAVPRRHPGRHRAGRMGHLAVPDFWPGRLRPD